jgi:DNA repair protein RadC
VGGVLAAGSDAQARVLGAGHPAVSHLGMIREVLLSVLRAKAAKTPILGTAQALIDYLFADMAHLPTERLRVLFLNAKNRLLRDEIVAEGSVNEISVQPREIVRRALEVGATALILAHNHPSGDPEPSRGDIETTRRIVHAAASLDICVHDHVIVAGSGWSSFKTLRLI